MGGGPTLAGCVTWKGPSTRSRPRPGSRASCASTAASEVELVKAYGLAHRGWGIPNEVDTRFGIASGTKGFTALTVMSLIEEGRLDLGDDRPLGARERPAAHRRGGHGRTPARPPIGHRRLLRRGDRARPAGLRVARSRPRARLDGGVPPGPRRVPDQVPTGRAVLVQQRRLRGARADRRARIAGTTVPRAGGATRVRTRRHGGYGVPALGRAPGPHRPRLPRRGRDRGPTSSTCRFEGAGTAASTRPRRTSAPCGPPCSPGASCRWTSSPRWCNPGATCRRRRNRPGSASGSGSTPPATWWSCTDRTRACRSRPTTTAHEPFTYTVLSNTTEGAWPIVLHLDELFALVSRWVSGSRRTRSDPGRCRVTTGTSRCPRAPSRSRAGPHPPA